MKKIILLNFIFISLISCDKILKDKNDSSEINNSDPEYIIGADKDENGCLVSAGFTWSVLRNECVRIFEIGYRLNPKQVNPDEAVFSAFVIFDKDKEQVELFLPDFENSFILVEDQKGIYKNDKYVFDSNEFILKTNNVVTYEAAKEQLQNIDVDSDVESDEVK